MTETGIPDDVRAFLRAHIRSVSELEVLLLLHRDPTRWWTADQVNGELRTSLQSALQCLQGLHQAALVEQKSGDQQAFRFNSENADVAAIVDTLATLFKDRMASIVDVIYAPRQDSLREFADAFRFTKKGGNGDG